MDKSVPCTRPVFSFLNGSQNFCLPQRIILKPNEILTGMHMEHYIYSPKISRTLQKKKKAMVAGNAGLLKEGGTRWHVALDTVRGGYVCVHTC